MKNTALKTAGVIFLLVSIFHLLRVIFKIEFIVGGTSIAPWISLIGFAVALLLSVWMFKSAK